MFLCPRCQAFNKTAECAHCNPSTAEVSAASSPPAKARQDVPLTKVKLFIAGIVVAAGGRVALMSASTAHDTEARWERGWAGGLTLIGFGLATVGVVRWWLARKRARVAAIPAAIARKRAD